MATVNPFDLLGDDDAEDLSQLISAKQLKASAPASAPAAAQAAKPAAKLPTKPPPPALAVKEAKNEGGHRGRGRGAGRGGGRGRGYNRDSADNENTFGNNNGFAGGFRALEDADAGNASERRAPYGGPRGGGGGGYRGGGGRRGGYSNGDVTDGERPRRTFDRRSGTGRGNEFKREGSGRGNWGTPTDEIAPENEEPVNEGEKSNDAEKEPVQEEVNDANKDSSGNEQEEKEPEEKEMTLEEYEKVREEKRKALLAHRSEERKVDLDKELQSMQLLSNKKNDDEVFIKLGSDKDKRKEAAEKAKKAVSINEFLKPAEGENYYQSGGRGRGRGRGRGGYGYGGSNRNNLQAPAIEDVGQFPSLGGK